MKSMIQIVIVHRYFKLQANDMLQSLDYVDPNLAFKIHTLQQQLAKLQQSKEQIISNPSLQPTTKAKLIRYQTECQENTRRILAAERDKLAEYLDEQTNVITKDNRAVQARHSYKYSGTLNQSTRIDLSTDDNKSFQTTRSGEQYRKVSSFYVQERSRVQEKVGRVNYPNASRVKMNRLKKRVAQQHKLIQMLVTWVKIYHEREMNFQQINNTNLAQENRVLRENNRSLYEKYSKLEQELGRIRSQYKQTSQSILQTHRQCEIVRSENKSLQLQRKDLIRTAKSITKNQEFSLEEPSRKHARI